MQFISTGPFSIPAGNHQKVAFAIIGGQNLQDLIVAGDAAQTKYSCIIEGNGPVNHSVCRILWWLREPLSTFQIIIHRQPVGSGILEMATALTPNQASHTYTQNGVYQVRLTVSDGTCTYSSTQTLTITDQVSNDPRIEPSVRIYPNPNAGNFSLEMERVPGNLMHIAVTNLMGQQVWHKEVYISQGSTKVEIDLNDAASGIYLLRISGAEVEMTRKVEVGK